MEIKVTATRLQHVLTDSDVQALEVPRFQRPYSWTKSEVSALIDDLIVDQNWRDVIELARPASSHFLGAIVLARRTDDGSLTVLDGQQRLATTSLMYVALRQLLIDEGTQQALENATKALSRLDRAGDFGGDSDLRLVLQAGDCEIFRKLVYDGRVTLTRLEAKRSLAKAYDQILDELRKFSEQLLAIADIDRTAAYRAIAQRLDATGLVKIVADSEADAFALFETLNDRGLSLSAADLLKNKLLGIAARSSDHALEQAADSWDALVDTIGRSELVNFLRYHFIAFHSSDGVVRKSTLYRDYEEHVRRIRPPAVQRFLDALGASAGRYAVIVDPTLKDIDLGDSVKFSIERLNLLRARSCRPLVLYCMQEEPQNLETVLQVIESAFVRAVVILEKNPNALEKVFGRVCVLHRAGGGALPELLVQELADYPGTNDAVFDAFLNTSAVSNLTGTWRAVLLRLNDQVSGGGGEARLYGSSQVHVEHILPQSPSDLALDEAGCTGPEAAEAISLVGNLTLLYGPKNQELSNSAYSVKQPVFVDSDVRLTRDVATRNRERFGVDEIKERTESLAHAALGAWPWPPT